MSCIYYSYTVAEPLGGAVGIQSPLLLTTYTPIPHGQRQPTPHRSLPVARRRPPHPLRRALDAHRPPRPPRILPLHTPPNLLRLPTPDSLPPLLRLVPLTPSVQAPVSSTSDLTDSTEHPSPPPPRLRLPLRPPRRSSPLPRRRPSTGFCATTPPTGPCPSRGPSTCAPPSSPSSAPPRSARSALRTSSSAPGGSPGGLHRRADWVPFPTSVAFRLPEARTAFGRTFSPDASGVSKAYRFGVTVRECDLVAVRSCVELEQEWLDLLKDIYGKTVLPVGHFPPVAPKESVAAASLKDWTGAFEWLDKRAHGSVVYVAFGSEVRLNREQVREIARGLELSGLPFIWALRWPNGLKEVLPEGFEDRTAGRGMVCQGWVPQVRLLGHPAVGGFMTHCGWSSVTEEGLQFGLALILVPMIFDQALSARLLEEKRVGKEVPRNDEDGAFDAIGISETLRLVMVEEGGKGYRARSRELKSVIGSKEVQDSYVTKFVEHLKSHRPA
ncbi:UDP-glycosyltransferase 91C1-like [Iris pallida]|uniref:UDP-glycosyltransferase 91C1-like n=1 Tax=Iris pallida TaxID=29817 RepID=A0AAX6E7D4_IRIPA|nr:UDP-glycosyltransferase 91C1-like [Iris pallida]